MQSKLRRPLFAITDTQQQFIRQKLSLKMKTLQCQSECAKKRKKFGVQLVKSEFLLGKKNVEGFNYSKVRTLKQHLKCYPAVQDHENL